MSKPRKKSADLMTSEVLGTFGFFTTQGPCQLAFFDTKMDVQDLGNLKTARQVFPRNELRIKELVQRDIDDSRVRNEIIPYLRPGKDVSTRPRFFPPIVVAVLPHQERGDRKLFDSLYPSPVLGDDGDFVRTKTDEDGWRMEMRYGDAFEVKVPLIDEDEDVRTTDSSKSYHYASEFRWNDKRVHLLVIDGQHRLIGLKAALGYLDENELALGYKSYAFDPHEVGQLGLRSIPVTIVFPPMLYFGSGALREGESSLELVQVYRTIFVDVNRTARTVSESRNILLNEYNLLSVFSRLLIESFTIEGDLPITGDLDGELPLYMCEWESPPDLEWKINEARAVTSIGVIQSVVTQVLCGDESRRQDEQFRSSLNVEVGQSTVDPAMDLSPQGVAIHELSPTNFALWQRVELEERFKEQWMCAIRRLLTGLYPAIRLREILESKRVELQKEAAATDDARPAILQLDYLIGTASDRQRIDAIAKGKEVVVSREKRADYVAAKRSIKSFLRDEVVNNLKSGAFSRVFFSHVGQLTLAKFVFWTLLRNAREGITPDQVVRSFVMSFNERFQGTGDLDLLFDRDAEWNQNTLNTLGLGAWHRNQTLGLWRVAFSLIRSDSAVALALQPPGGWEHLTQVQRNAGIEDEIAKALASRLPYQVRYEEEIVEIADQVQRSRRISQVVNERTSEITARLRELIGELEV